MWNPHHYCLDRLKRKQAVSALDVNHSFFQVRKTNSDKRLYDEIVSTYANIAMNMGAIREIALKKMRQWFVFSKLFSVTLF